MKQLIIFKIFVVMLFITSSTAFAAQIRIAEKDGQIAGVISSSEVSRITIEGDRIVSLASVPKGFGVEHDTDTGDLYLVPHRAGLSGAIINMFITSESGRSFQLLLAARDIPSEQIIIRVPGAISGTGAKTAIEAPRREELSRLIKGVITGGILDDYQRSSSITADINGEAHRDFFAEEIWVGDAFTALSVKINNPLRAYELRNLPRAAATWVSHDGLNGVVVFEAISEEQYDDE